jgi:branched-subunit amino acid aminotransferase/4-amino-4-deoxychorismate lyase
LTLLAAAVDGRGLVDPDAPVFHADDEALLRGSAAFETLRVYGGEPFELDAHLERLAGSMRVLALPDLEADVTRGLVAQVVDAAGRPDFVLRLYRTDRTAIATAAPLPDGLDAQRERGLALRTVDVGPPTGLLARVKSTSYALAFAGRRDAQRHGDDDVLFVADGRVLECATANIWWRDGDVLSTPAPGAGVLPGVTRGVVAGLAGDAGYRVRQGSFTLRALLTADEAFTSSSIMELMPVVAVDGNAIGGGRPGEAAARLQAALRLRSAP